MLIPNKLLIKQVASAEKGIVVFTQRVEEVEFYHERRDCTDQKVSEFILACGYLPIPIPNNENIAEDIIKTLKPVGIVLTGGNSLVKYGGTAPERDAMDKICIRLAVNLQIPLYGFCRGMQSILDFYGEEIVPVTGHVATRMTLTSTKDGRVCNFSREVNSYHKQGCKKISNPALEALAVSGDGVIKAIQHKELSILGTMWHPEREKPFAELDIKMVQGLLEREGIT